MAGALTFLVAGLRPWRTSWLMVGTKTLLLSRFATEVGGRLGLRPAVSRRHSPLGKRRETGLRRWLAMDPGAHAVGGPLLRPRSRSVAAARRTCQTIDGPRSRTNQGLTAVRGDPLVSRRRRPRRRPPRVFRRG